MTNTLQKQVLYVKHESNGSQGVLSLNSDPSGTFKTGPAQSNITWGESWVGSKCYLWVVFPQKPGIRIWGCQLALSGPTIAGTGMSAFGAATPGDPTNTTFANDDLTLTNVKPQ